MSFWATYPFQNILEYITNTHKFKSLIFERTPIELPVNSSCVLLQKNDYIHTEHIRQFIKKYFGNPPDTPILDIPHNLLLGERDIVLYMKDNKNNIIGCIRHHYIGEFISNKNEEMYCVDCFCIHPEWRKKGIGRYLLSTLHNYININNKPYLLFLKEGRSLSITNIPYYSSMYVYRKVDNISNTTDITEIPVILAYSLMNIFRGFNKELFIIRNNRLNNQRWKLYKKGMHYIMVCFQDTYQYFYVNSKRNKIGWVTAWFESPNIPDDFREKASIELSNSIYPYFDYVWFNKEWIGEAMNDWKIDGHFHWYLYQWITSIRIDKSYCLLV
jgi:hypothetical protein